MNERDCSKRRREAVGNVGDPGELIFRAPACPRCYHETEFDGDSFSCLNCSTSWDADGKWSGQYCDDFGELPTVLDGVVREEGASCVGA